MRVRWCRPPRGRRRWSAPGRGGARKMRGPRRRSAAPGAPTGRMRLVRSSLADVRRLQPLRALDDVELDPLPFLQGPEPVGVDGGVVDEDVLAALLGDEAEALRIIEPLHGTRRHRNYLAERREQESQQPTAYRQELDHHATHGPARVNARWREGRVWI